MFRAGIFEQHRLDSLLMTVPGGATAVQAFFGPVPQGYAWYVENVGFCVLGASHTSTLDVLVTPDDTALPTGVGWDRAGLVGSSAGAQVKGSINPASAFYAGPGHSIHMVATAGTLAAADVVCVTAQIAVHQLDPQWMTSPEDRAQIREAHERLAEHQVAEVATASRRAV